MTNLPAQRRQRVLVALGVGLVFGLVAWLPTTRPGFQGHAFQVWWFGAQALMERRNPYTTILFRGGPGYFYPPAAALVALPFAWLPHPVAGVLFVGLSCALLAYVVTRHEWWPLLMFASGSLLVAADAAHLELLLVIGFFDPGAAWLGAIKPNIGLAMLAHRPRRRSVALMAVLSAATLLLLPTWPLDWFRTVRASTYHFAPIFAPGGPLLLIALTRWRLPEGRLLAAMAVLPSSPVVYEALPLFVIPKTWRQMLFLVVVTLAAHACMLDLLAPTDIDRFMSRGRWVVVWLCYLPALALVIRRRNEGPAPAWVERLALRCPPWLRGVPA